MFDCPSKICCIRKRCFQMKIFVYYVVASVSTHLSDRCFVQCWRVKIFWNFRTYFMLNSLPGISKNISTKKKLFPGKISNN